MIHIRATTEIRFDDALQYAQAKTRVQAIAEQAGAVVQWRDASLTAVIHSEVDLESL